MLERSATEYFTIFGSRANAMPVHRSDVWLAVTVNEMTFLVASTVHSATYLHVDPEHAVGYDHLLLTGVTG